MRRREQAGFSLAELVVVLGLVALLAGAVAVGISRSTTGSRLRAGAEWTSSVVRQAVRLAWTRHEPVRIQFQTGTLDMTVTRWNGSSWAPVSDFFSTLDANRPQGVVVSSTSYPSNVLTITPIGLGLYSVEASVYVTEGEVVLSSGGAAIRVTTSRDGRVTVQP